MSYIDDINIYNDPIISRKRKGTADSPYKQITETLTVDNGKVVLTEIPNIKERVIVKNGATTLGEVENGSALTENIFSVDYPNGVVYFHSSNSNQSFDFTYLGEGAIFFPASRVWIKGGLGETVQTLKETLDSSTETISNIQSSIDDANQATTNANTATANYQTLLDQQKLIYKQSVATFSSIATTYPTPESGWRVVVKDTGIAYRFDGTLWIEVDMSTTVEGFNVTISDKSPANVNVLWLNIPNVNKTTRVIKSSTAPADTSVIWWEL